MDNDECRERGCKNIPCYTLAPRGSRYWHMCFDHIPGSYRSKRRKAWWMARARRVGKRLFIFLRWYGTKFWPGRIHAAFFIGFMDTIEYLGEEDLTYLWGDIGDAFRRRGKIWKILTRPV